MDCYSKRPPSLSVCACVCVFFPLTDTLHDVEIAAGILYCHLLRTVTIPHRPEEDKTSNNQ